MWLLGGVDGPRPAEHDSRQLLSSAVPISLHNMQSFRCHTWGQRQALPGRSSSECIVQLRLELSVLHKACLPSDFGYHRRPPKYWRSEIQGNRLGTECIEANYLLRQFYWPGLNA